MTKDFHAFCSRVFWHNHSGMTWLIFELGWARLGWQVLVNLYFCQMSFFRLRPFRGSFAKRWRWCALPAFDEASPTIRRSPDVQSPKAMADIPSADWNAKVCRRRRRYPLSCIGRRSPERRPSRLNVVCEGGRPSQQPVNIGTADVNLFVPRGEVDRLDFRILQPEGLKFR